MGDLLRTSVEIFHFRSSTSMRLGYAATVQSARPSGYPQSPNYLEP
ncbi:hypothetical protein S7335_5057 [Synechococcus sp. PCC 7335]|nr:hypothetical protein S7335_5057 [Synechococcus sp. PCC 7335]